MLESGKNVAELRVCDLKDELEKRKLETVGPKAVLIERLQRALKEEGIDPNTHLIVPAARAKKSLPKPIESDVHIKEEPVDPEEENEEASVETAANADGVDNPRHADDDGHEIDQVGDVDDECVILDDEDDDDEEQEADDDYGRKKISTEEDADKEDTAEKGEEKTPTDNELQEENTGDTVNIDNDESINLTIGEDEQQLLHDEAPDDKSIKSVKPANKLEKLNTSKDVDKKNHKEDEGTRLKKKDEKTAEKKDISDQKLASKSSSQKDDKEKSSTAAAVATAGTATASSGAAANKTGSGLGSSGGTGGASASSSAAGKQALLSRNLWVSGLSTLTRASDLKAIFSKFGKVIGAKVVTNTRTPGTRCYGYVTMSSSGDASRCIENLHRTELHGRIISVERTKNEIGSSASSSKESNSKGSSKANNKPSDAKKKDDDKKCGSKGYGVEDKKGGEGSADGKSLGGESGSKRDGKDKDRNKLRDEKDKSLGGGDKRHERDHRSGTGHKSQNRDGSNERRPGRHPRDVDREIQQRQRERERRQREMLSYQKIREERERQRLREREREIREEERRRREARERQRVEEERLAEERRKLAIERERLEREKAELLRMERERQKLEREKIELERLELKRQQMKIMESRDDPVKRSASKRTDDRYNDASDRKRSAVFDAPPPPRFDASLVSSRNTSSYDKKHDDYGTSSSSKRSLEDYSSSKRLEYSNKRGDYGSTTGTKRGAMDDYGAVPSKRSGGNDYVSSSSKHDYQSSTTSKRDDYKREVEVRHLPVSSGGVGASGSSGSYVHKSNSGGVTSSYVHKNNTGNVTSSYAHKNNTNSGSGGGRYNDSDRSNNSNYRRGGVDDTHSMSHGNKRYENSTSSGAAGGYGSNSNNVNIWAPSGGGSGSGHLGGSSGPLKSYTNNGMSSNMHGNNSWQKSAPIEDNNWRPMTQTPSRFDRTYNDRSGGYQGNSGAGGGMYGGSRPTQDRYGGQVGRY
ncbi:LOW QUALITY PROTEIN: SAFB-like transcription modulator [Drosophila nasuta]|uniref:LOW QUALITY PROTEIN: SAFB-like transcription modulator n=1 Tax=Drosophila nasuta TaxID=42062 RepID=UPI00295F39AA|nr:LOW QUALITY PROTEIN: SAFB-like transcription modulator [Drosophila nasuta]